MSGHNQPKAKARARIISGRLLCTSSLSALALFALPSIAHAQDANRNWDANSTAPGNGGTGTWSTTAVPANQTWSPNTDGVSGPYTVWNNALLDNAIFGGTAGTVTLGTPITVHNITFNTANYTITGDTLTLAGVAPTITVNSGTSTISSIVAGSAGLKKAGGGTLTLSANNSFTGDVTVDAGTLTLSGSNSFTGVVVNAGTLNLNGTNNFTGAIDVNGGTLVASTNASLGNAANVIDLAGGATLKSTGLLTGRVVNLTGGQAGLLSGAAAAHFTGTGGISAASCGSCGVVIELSDNTNDFTGQVTLTSNNGTGVSFTSVRNAGQASALGAGGTINLVGDTTTSAFRYTGTGDSSNRDWQITTSGGGPTPYLVNNGTGTLTLTGNISASGNLTPAFGAESADLQLLGVLSGAPTGAFRFLATGGTITLGNNNSFTSGASVDYGVVKVGTLANSGVNSSLGAGSVITVSSNGVLSYTGAAASSNRAWQVGLVSSGASGSILNDGSGALALGGNVAFAGVGNNNLTLGGSYTGSDNVISGVVSGTGNLVSSGPATWVLSGANTRSGTITMNGGTLRGTNASSFGTVTGLTVTGGTLDTGGFNLSTPSLTGSGGTIALGAGTLTVNSTAAQPFGGSINGTGGLTKLGTGTLTLTGASTYTGPTTVNASKLTLDFSPVGGTASNIISSGSALNLSGGSAITIKGEAGQANSQTFNGLNISSGSNIITATGGTGGSLTVDLGAINRTGGIVNFVPTNATLLTSNASLGGWAMINNTDYAKVVGGQIVAFDATDYTNKDNAAAWLDGEFVSDEALPANSAFTGTVSGSKQLGGIRYTAAAGSTVNIGAGQTLGVDGAILVAPSVGGQFLTIQGGAITGSVGGGALGVQQNSGSVLTISSTIVDNGGSTGFTKGGTGRVQLGGTNTYTGATTLSQGTLLIGSVANAGSASAIGAASAASSNLILEGGILQYVGSTASTDRGFTIVDTGTGGATIQVDGTANLTFGGVVTSPDSAALTKTGTGTLTLSGATNDYVGVTTIAGGTLAVSTLANGGVVSSIGASSSASANLVLQGNGELEYTGPTAGTNRGFTLAGPGAVDVANGATTLTVGGIVAGAGALSKNGAGTLLLSGANTFTAGGYVNAGTLRAGSAQAFGTGGWTVASGATLDLAGFNNTIGVITGSGTVNLGSARLTINNASAFFPFSGIISGSGGVTVTGAGTAQVMSGCGNNYTGSTILQGSTILSVDCLANGGSASGIGASGSASTNLVFNTGALNYTGGNVTTNRGFQILGGVGAIGVGGGTTLTFSGVATGAGILRKDGDGILELSGANTLTGGTSITGGTLRAGSATALSPGSMGLSNVAGVTLDLNNFNVALTFLAGGGALGGNITLGSGSLTVNYGAGTTQAYAGAISGTGGFIKAGHASFVQSLSGCNSSYTGATTISSGTLMVDCLRNGGLNSAIGASDATAGKLILNGGTLRYVGTATSTDRLLTLGSSASSKIEASGVNPADTIAFTNTGAIAYSAINTAQTITLGGTNTGNNSFAALITDNGTGKTTLTKADGGTWILTNPDSSYTGITTIAGGVLGVDKLSNGGFASSIGRSASAATNLVIGTGSTLRYTGAGDSTDRLFTLQTGVSFIESSGSGAIAFTNTGTMGFQGSGTRILALGGTNTGANILGVSITDGTGGATTLAKNDGGNWFLTGNSTYTGLTNINAGTLFIGNGGTTGSITGNTVNVTGFGALGFNRSDTMTYAGTIQGSGGVTQAGTGTTVLTGANSYTGGTTISAGTLQLGSAGATGSIVGNVANNGTLAFNRNNAYTFAGVISGSGAVTQIGSGTTTLTGNSSYGGTTNVSGGGELRIAGGNTVSSGGSTGVFGATLSVDGSGSVFSTASITAQSQSGVAGNVNVQNGGILRTTGGNLVLRNAPTGIVNTSLTVTGVGSLADVAGGLMMAASTASNINSATISAGGALRTTVASQIGAAAGNTTAPLVTITGVGSNWTSTSSLAMTNGTFSLLNGGVASFDTAMIGSVSAARLASMMVSGTNSHFTTAGNLVIGSGAGTGVLTLADGGRAAAGGTFVLADAATATGVLNIGGAEGQAAAAAGFLDATALGFGSATSRVNFNHTETNYAFATAMSGAGAINQVAGVTNLTGNSAGFTGPTTVSGGTLRVNGTLGDATSTVDVQTGATLGGAGTIGGNVTIAGGGRLSPGNSPGTLTIAGELTLDPASQLDFELGEANVAGGTYNDLINVGGNLTLDGTLNITESAGGTFGRGIYRLINYDGTLTDNVLDIAGAPAGLTIQTSVANQVNLINTQGLVLRYWDGDAGPKDNGVIDGGSGTWQVSSGNDNWTDEVGTPNGGYLDSSIAMFQGTAGTVTVDDSLGAINVSGLQFVTSGYVIQGDAINMVEPQTVVRVGDGTLAETSYVATINAQLAGSGQLAKADGGTLVLGGTNSYTGGTAIFSGTLRISSDANLGAASGGLTLEGGTLNTTATVASARGVAVNSASTVLTDAGTTLTLSGAVSGAGALTKSGTGTLTLIGDATHTGGTTVSAGTLQVGAGGATGSITGDIVNNAALTFNRSGSLAYGGAITGTGAINIQGGGTLTLTGVSNVSGATTLLGTNLWLAGGGKLSSGTFFGAGSNKTITVSGAGSELATTSGNMFINSGGFGGSSTTLLVENGGVVRSAGTFSAAAATLGPHIATVTVTGPGSLIESAGIFAFATDAAGSGTLTVNAGGRINSAGATIGSFFTAHTTPPSMTITGSGSQWTMTGAMNHYAGSMSVLNGGAVSVGTTGAIGSGPTRADLLVSGPGSSYAVAGNLTVGNNAAGGFITLADGGLLDVGGLLTLANGAGRTGILNIGGAEGQSAAAAGVLDAVTLAFGAGTGRVNFNHTDTGYTFGTVMSGNGAVNQVAGTTILTGDSSYTGGTTISSGTLQLGNGGATGSITGNVATNGTLAFNRDNSYTFAGVISGSGAVTQIGTGTTTLTGTNTYAGGTLIGAGTLSVSSDANLGDAAGAVTFDGGTLNNTAAFATARGATMAAGGGTIQTDADLTWSGAITGTGALTKTGAGSLILTGANNYAGGTTISAGTLQIGDGATSGSIVGDVVNNAALVFDRSDAVTFGGMVSGTGSLTQTGTGTLTLTGVNSYSGGTLVDLASTLQISSDANLGDAAGGLTLRSGTLHTTADIASARDIDIIDGGSGRFNTDAGTTLTLTGDISGTGGLDKIGAGTLILTGTNSYSGGTVVYDGGTLLINGDNSAVGGTTIVSDATLGGIGTIGGDAVVVAGGRLAAGSNDVGTLTINGGLAFDNTGRLLMEFGQSNVVGGPLNDFLQVGGDLTLDGTIDVTVTAGGSFGPGLYRVISYGGALDDQGLDLGTLPPGAVAAVQTSIAGQVNLVNAAAGSFNFWDGANPANESNNLVDGGNGTWQNSSGNNDWTTTTGAVSGPYTDGAFAIFAAPPGTVSIDNGLGAVTASGLQFASDGYTITGQDLTLVGPQSTIRVGDGTAAGLGMTATIEAALIGSTQLVKADLGTLVLAGANSYTGGTQIDAGTLRIASDANLGDAAGGLAFNGGTLNTTADIGSSRAVSLLGTGTFSTDAGTTLTLGGAVTGTGGFTKAGTGILVLTGTNSFGGAVDVTAGSLFVNGDQSAATGLTSVASGATLGGSGIIGGDVTLADGATLAAGTGNVGTLAVNGNLALSSGTVLNYEFGQANAAGGSLNDLVTVGGNLTLDGTINVSVPATGSFGPGIYRVFNYGGALTDNGLTLGTLPGGSAVSVQTAIAGQVNLVNTAGLTLSFWDGNAGPMNNGVVNGGNGVWRAAGGLTNWTETTGALNADYAQDSFAIFSAAPGTVTIDNVGGVVQASGLQFASDGYTITGDALTLTGAQATVQVGDGSAASAAYTAGIASELTGSAGLVKTDAGRLILTGANSYTGGTTIDGGTLQIGNGGATGSITGDIVNNGALVVNRTGTLTLDGAISGTGTLAKAGSGTLILGGTNSYAGGTTISGGTVRISSDANLGDVAGRLSLQGATLQASASFTSARDILVGSPTANRIDTQGFDVTLTGAIGNGANNQANNLLDKIGSGTLTLTGANIYASRTMISGGTLALAGAGTAGAGNIIVGAGTVFDISQANTGARVLQLNSGPAGTIALGSKTLTLGLDNTFSDWSGTITDGGIAGGTGGRVVIAGPGGAVRYLQANSYTGGTTILSGSLELVGSGSLYSGGAVTVVTGGTFSIAGLAGPGTTIGDLSGSGSGSTPGAVVLGAKTLTFGTANDTNFSGVISGSGALVKAGTGTFTLTGTGSHTGGTTIAAGTLQIGSGGVSGSITGDIVNNGMLTFNRSNAMTFDGMISGSGALHQFGSGTTILTGANSYARDTTVSAGTLLVNGNQSLATGLTNALGGATLGGTGTIGGDVFVGGGATLAPGSGGVGTLTINGDLGFSPNATLAFEFGQANLPGGALNDLINVGGNLTLGGTIDVTQSAGGSFGPGLYRIINYAGTLTNNGLTVGTMPAGSQAFVQTVVPGQVNLVNTAGLTLNFWDGATGARNDGAIQGGVGTWRVGGGENNWTEASGAVNADYAQDSFAIFSGLGGTVTIDNGNGNVRAAGMQFAVDGYTLMGGPLELTGTQAFVRVGDGSAGDAAITATIASALTGSARLVKDMGGTLILTGANSYTGGTAINGGTLDVSSDANLGDAAGGLSFDGGTLDITTTFASNRSVDLVGTGTFVTQGTGFVLRGAVSGAGALVKEGNGSLTLTADNSHTGGTTINAGVLNLGEGGATGSILGNIVNNGRFAINRSNMYTLTGTISGSGELFQAGTGTTILTAANSYTGVTRVSAGTLLINGDQSAATGLTSVAPGATLGGTGTIGGDVRVGGGTLAPGAGGAGTLTINGDLSLVSASHLAFDFGRANAPGDPLNDVVNIGGNLTLDGTIDVAVTPGGAFDIGLYRIANYAGTLTNNGLAIGTMPAGAELAVQTSILGQVNLVNTGSAVLNFWDGNTGPKFNGAVNGGSGVWWATGTDNWTDMTGAVNASYDNGAFAVFAGRSGLVTIDNSQGAVTASGLQIAASGGYVIQGGALTLTGPQSVIRVGDGTTAGIGYSATITSGIIGNTQLVKTDLGRLVLAGVNSYTGGTAINGGTLRISSDANLGAASGGISFNGGTLNTTADLTSARTVDLAGQGVFSTDAGTTLTLTGNLTGAGLIGKLGAGTLVLAGTGSRTGGMEIVQGTLLVNGNYAAATGPLTMNQITTLGGTGTIGGSVNLSGTLAPGAGGVGTLTIGGDLAISPSATLAYEFGQANVAGGALNDLVNVGGNLTLDGTINVTVPTGGAFDAGVYRVFNYGGALTNNGLTLGALPAGSNVTVQTSIAGQVNLVNSAGLSLAFWDGAAGPKNNGVINGGTGTWQNGTGNDNWANANGTVNGPYSDGAFAVFGGTGGSVTVDNGLGQVTSGGMQFAANGYTLAGGGIALTGPQSTIRVGDGSATGSGFTAAISSALSGDTQLVKTDAGTLVLGGINSYTGGTRINAGTLQIASDANLGAAAGGVTLDGGTLATSANVTSARDIVMAGTGTIATASGTTFTLSGRLTGTGAFTKAGAGTLVLTGDSSGYAGSTQVSGTLAVNGSLCGDVNVLAGGRLQGTGTVCTTVNAGTIATGNSIGTLTVAGNYTGNGGTLEVEAELGGDSSPSDRLVVTGTTSGTTQVVVINQGGLGAATVEGIKIVDVGGASNGVFTLDGDYVFEGDQAVIAGAYGYRLYKNGVSTPADGDWYLRSSLLDAPNPGTPNVPLYQPGVPVYEAYGQTMLALNELGTLQQRVGNRQWAQTESGKPSGIWGRMEARRARPNAAFSTSLADVNVDSWKAEIGADHVLGERSDGATLVLGVLGGYGEANAGIASLFGNGSIKTKGYSAGATMTWFGPQGFYVDGRAQLTWFDSKLKSAVLGTLADGNDGTGQAYSVEVGKRAAVGGNLSVTPQIQMAYSTVGFDRFTDPNGAMVSSKLGDSLKTRWGIALDRQDARSHLYGVANLSYEWLDGTVTDVSGTPIARENHRLWGELGLGGSLLIGDRLTLYTEASANTAVNDFGKSYSLKGTAGLRLAF